MVAGDLVFVRGKTLFSKFIRLCTGSDITHVALALDADLIIEAEGFQRISLFRLSEKGYDYEIVSLNQRIDTKKLFNISRKYLNGDYDYRKSISLFFALLTGVALPVINTKCNFTCVELVKEILRHFDISLPAETPGGLYKEALKKVV